MRSQLPFALVLSLTCAPAVAQTPPTTPPEPPAVAPANAPPAPAPTPAAPAAAPEATQPASAAPPEEVPADGASAPPVEQPPATSAEAETSPATGAPAATTAATASGSKGAADASPGSGPIIELADEDLADTTLEPERSSEEDTLRGLKEQRMRADATGIGGYGELHYNLKNASGPEDSEGEIDLHRLVLFLSHNFNDRLSFYSEVEVEHAFVGEGAPGEVGVEQALVDYRLAGDALALRAGVVLVPMGIINQWHEPPIFHGVERPSVDKVIIPSTWREGGIGIFGEPSEGLRYELYVVGGLNAASFRARDGVRGGRQGVAEARADGLAVTGRLELEPTLGVIAGLAAYFGLAGPNADFFDAAGEDLDLDVPVWGASGDVRGRAAGFEARAVVAVFGIGDTVQLRDAHDADGAPLGIDVGSLLWGAYGELAYDVLHTVGTEHQLLPFVRVERYDTLAEVEGRSRTPADDALAVTELAFGLSYRPAPQVVFKGDYILKSPGGPAETTGQLDLGVGVMF